MALVVTRRCPTRRRWLELWWVSTVSRLQVHKRRDIAGAESTLSRLSAEGRVEEIARMLGGEQITARTRAHAREMLAFVEP